MENNYCPNCGTRLTPEDVGSCPNCGSPIRATPAAAPAHEEPPVAEAPPAPEEPPEVEAPPVPETPRLGKRTRTERSKRR